MQITFVAEKFTKIDFVDRDRYGNDWRRTLVEPPASSSVRTRSPGL